MLLMTVKFNDDAVGVLVARQGSKPPAMRRHYSRTSGKEVVHRFQKCLYPATCCIVHDTPPFGPKPKVGDLVDGPGDGCEKESPEPTQDVAVDSEPKSLYATRRRVQGK